MVNLIKQSENVAPKSLQQYTALKQLQIDDHVQKLKKKISKTDESRTNSWNEVSNSFNFTKIHK